MNRSLRMLTPKLPPRLIRSAKPETAMFWTAVTAIVLSFLLPSNVLDAMHADVFKFLPATYVAVVGGLIALCRMSLHRRSREAPGLLLFIFTVPVLGIYSAYWQGFSGTVVYVESYWIAGLLALMLEPASPKQKRLLGIILLVICLANVAIALQESLAQAPWFPLVIDPDKDPSNIPAVTDQFRAHAFYSHPLNASLITTMAIFLLYTMRLRFIVTAPIFVALLVGLLAFGGRTALGVALIVSAGIAIYMLFRGIVRRNLTIDFVVTIAIAALVVPLIIAIIATQTSIADRIMENLYYDDSAATRATQWQVLEYLNLRNWLFGIPHTDLDLLKYQIGLGGKDTDIENFWLLMMLNLGLIGFMLFLFVLGVFLVHLGRYANSMYGWIMIASALIIDSTSNSLGVRSNDLFLEVAFVVAIAGYEGYAPVGSFRKAAGRRLGLRQKESVLSDVPVGVHSLRVR